MESRPGSVTNTFSAVLSGTAQEVSVGSHQMAEHSDTGSMESYPEELLVEANADCGDYVVESVDVREYNLQPVCFLTEGPATNGLEAALRDHLSTESMVHVDLDAGPLATSTSSFDVATERRMSKVVQFVCDLDSRHGSIKTAASTRTPTPFPSPRSSATSFGEAEAAGAFLTHGGAQASDTDEAKGEDAVQGSGLHLRPEGDDESSFFRKMGRGVSAIFTQRRFTFLQRFTRTPSRFTRAPSPCLGCPKLMPTERSALGNHVQMVREMLADLVRSCPCSPSNQVTVTVVPSNSREQQQAKARQSPERMKLGF
ncbi:uncharacterized protein LOC134082128 isoform X3 [Sardina pilchardus]|uniref:uncharacterized protein LOC134082128 isoform X3 n=1 Tax=Sardina pilchardus TaxID=27697 RepID=UPI002E107063